MKRVFACIAFSLLGLLMFPRVAHGHILLNDSTMTALFHIDPDDDPFVGEESNIHISLSEKENRLNTENCDCKLSIQLNGKEVLSQSFKVDKNFFTQVPFTFSEKGVYHLVISGSGTNNSFPPFSMSMDQRVERLSPTAVTPSPSPLSALTIIDGVKGIHVSAELIVFLVIALLILVYIDERIKTKGLAAVVGVILIFVGIQVFGQNPLIQKTSTSSSNATKDLSVNKNKRYTVSLEEPPDIRAKQNTRLFFKIFDASNGEPIRLLQLLHEQPLHVVIVDENLKYFSHTHPKQEQDLFALVTQFPHDGIYRLYLNFLPFGGTEQQIALTLRVGNGQDVPFTQPKVDESHIKDFGGVTVNMQSEDLSVKTLLNGKAKMNFTLTDTKSGKNATLTPYLGAFGHLILINTQTYEYIHIHPTNMSVKPTEVGGPTVEFTPMNLFDEPKPGVYRAFAEFNANGKLTTADFTLDIR